MWLQGKGCWLEAVNLQQRTRKLSGYCFNIENTSLRIAFLSDLLQFALLLKQIFLTIRV